MNNKAAFTLVELLVIVLIIGILAAIAVPQYQKAVDESRFSSLIAVTEGVAKANEMYYLENGRYTTDFNDLVIDVPAKSISGNVATFDWGNCTLGDQQEVRCYNNTTLKNQYIIHYNFASSMVEYRGQTLCTAITTERDSRFDQVCANVGTYDKSASCDGGSCFVYKINKNN